MEMFIFQGYSSQKTIYTSYKWGYIYTEVNHTIYVWRGTISAVYFMYKSRAFNAKPVNKLEKPGTEKAKIGNHNNNRWNMTSKEQGLQ